MRLGVLDVGSNTVRLVVAEVDGAVPLPIHTEKRAVRLAGHVDAAGYVGDEAVGLLIDAVAAARRTAAGWDVAEPFFAFATSIVRDAPNSDAVLSAVERATGVALQVMDGRMEAELTFRAARRWMGWRAGPMVLLDIGGGSFEVAFGRGGLPDFAVSLPLGAGRLTREYLAGQDPPTSAAIAALRRRVRHELRDTAARVRWETPHTAVATSRTFQQLARLCGAAPRRLGPFISRRLDRADLRRAIDRLAAVPAAARAQLPGISAPRAWQSLAGALIAHTAMKTVGVDSVMISPWALREGVLLRHIEVADPAWWQTTAMHAAADASETTKLRLVRPS
jgi:exopolyphosphatase / guanosine-5'-triphosphate,3'-diphosphate pyrophosphatase